MLGIDVAKDNLVCTLVDPQTRRTLWENTVANTTAGITRLLNVTPGDTAWVLEPTWSAPILCASKRLGLGRVFPSVSSPAGREL